MLDARRHIDIIQKKYDPENDTIPGAPAVTWTDMQLAYIADRLRHKVKELEARIEQLERERVL